MRTDELFYEFFREKPKDLFRLIGQEVYGDYTFESITIKTTEKRLDGILIRVQQGGVRTFFEAQGYLDKRIYWRGFRGLATYHELNGDEGRFQIVFLFLDEAMDPGIPEALAHWEETDPLILCRRYLVDCFKKLGEDAGELNVLRPIITKTREELYEHIGTWQNQIKALSLTTERLRTLMDLLIYAVTARFQNITREELVKMLQLSPIEESVAYREIKEEGRVEGELIGAIRLLQEIKGFPIQSSKELSMLSLGDLKTILDQLRN
ncbi:MAG: DUF2887 domain-containing protein [Acidobacteriota bacterium]|nr:DUF2887 domain-containing protein [Acidobacteriota bacterium]